MIKVFNRVAVELIQGNIIEQYGYTAVVNAANAELLPGGGVAGAIHSAAGPELVKECRPLAPIKPGEAVITKAYNLPNRFVIHTLGPVYGLDKNEKELLRRCYLNSLILADKEKIDSIAFPAISTGAFSYPMKEAAGIALRTIIDMTGQVQNIKFIRMVLVNINDYKLFEEIFEKLILEENSEEVE